MKKYHVKFLRLFEVDVEADDIKIAEALARQLLAQFPAGTCKVLEIRAEDYVEPIEKVEPTITDAAAKRNEGLAAKVDKLLPKEPA